MLGAGIRQLVALIAGAWAGGVTGYIVSDALSIGWELAAWTVGAGAVIGGVAGLALYSLVKRDEVEEPGEYYSWDDYGYANPYEAPESGVEPYEYYDLDDEIVLRIWALTKSLLEKLTSKPLKPVIVVYTPDGVPEAVYPDDSPVLLDDDEPLGFVSATQYDGYLVVSLSYQAAARLADATRSGDKFKARSESDLEALYMLAKALALALGQNSDIAAYSAYKAVLKLVEEGVVDAPQHLLEKMPFEAEEVRRRVKEQVKLETDTAPQA